MTGFYKDYADSSDTHQNSAEASADAAEVSANEAAASAAAVLVSENNASASEQAALASQSSASASATSASTSATSASASQSSASASATNASASATSASTDADDAEDSATEAAASASEAATSLAAQEDLEVTSASFDTTDGTLTLTKANSGTITTDLDGRYAELTGATFTGDVTFNEKIEFQKGSFSSYPTIEHWQTNLGSSSINGLFIDGEDRLIMQSSVYLDLKSYGNLLRLYGSSGHKFLECKLDSDDLRTTILYHGNSNEKLRTVSDGILVDSKVEAELFKGDLEGAVHFKGAVASGATLAKGDVVYVSGYSGGKTEVDLADASDSNKMPAFGIVAADPVGVNVDVVTFGTLKSINTSTYTDGDELYVDTTAGGLTATAPSGEGNLVQKIAKVVRAANSGNIKVMGAGRTNATPNLNDGNIFIGDSNNVATTASFATEVDNATTGKADLSGADFTGDVNIADDTELQFGTSNDLRLYHDSTTNSSIIREQGTGSLLIQGDDLYITDTNGAKYLLGISGGQTKLYHNGAEKLDTKSAGINVTGDITLTGTVDGVDIATLNSNAIVDGDFTTAGIMTTDGSGVYSVDSSTYATETYVDTAVSNLVDSAPATLDTLNELASALGDDANFSTTVTNSIGTKWTEDATKISNWDTAYSNTTKIATTSSGIDVTGNIVVSGTVDGRDVLADGTKLDLIEANATADQTGAEIKSAYEAVADTNAFTDAEKTKLSNIEASADVTDTVNVTAAGALMDSEVTNLAQVKAFDSSDYLTAHQDISGKANLSGGTFTGNVNVQDALLSANTGSQQPFFKVSTVAASGSAGVFVDGDIVVNGTVDGVDIAGLNTTVASKANLSGATFTGDVSIGTLPSNPENLSVTGVANLYGGANVTGNIAVAGTVDGRDVSVDGARLDTIPYHRVRDDRISSFNQQLALTTANVNLGQYQNLYHPSTPVETMRFVDVEWSTLWSYISTTNNDIRLSLYLTVPSTVSAVSIGTANGFSPSSYYSVRQSNEAWYWVSGNYEHLFTEFGRISQSSSGNIKQQVLSVQYQSDADRTYFCATNTTAPIVTGDTVYFHPYGWQNVNTQLLVYKDIAERYRSGTERHNVSFKLPYTDDTLIYKLNIKELSSTDSAIIKDARVRITSTGI